MAFSSIGWDGYGVVTYCDGTTDTAGGSWAEEGGGTFSYNTDTYLTGAGSIGSQYANKSGYTYYTATTSFDFTSGSTGSGTQKVPGQYMYFWINLGSDSSVEPLADEGLSIIIGSADNANRHWLVAGSDDSNGWGSGWKLFIIDPTTAGTTDDGTYDAGNIDTWGLWIDTQVSVRAETIFIDQIAVASGVKAHSGVGTLEDIITYCYGTLATRVIGSYTTEGRFNFLVGPTIIGDSSNQTADTELTATSQINGYILSEYYNGASWVSSYPADLNKITLEKHASYATSYTGANTSMFGVDNSASTHDQWLVFGKDAGATFVFNGGTFEKLAAMNQDADWDVQNCVFSDCGIRTILGGTFENNVVSDSSYVKANTTITKCTFINHTLYGTEVPTLTNLEECIFKGGGSYAAYLPTAISSDVSMIWDCTESGYVAGSAGSDVGVTPTGGETIWVDVDSGITLTINVASGASTPSVANAGIGTVEVVAGQYDHTLEGLESGTEVTYVTADTTTVLFHVESASLSDGNGKYKTVYTQAGGASVDILIHNTQYQPDISNIYGLTLPSTDATVKVQMFWDDNQI